MPAHGAVTQRDDAIRYPGIDQRLGTDDTARAAGAVHDDERIRGWGQVVYAVDQLTAWYTDAAGDIHVLVFLHRPAVQYHQFLARIELGLQLLGRKRGRSVLMLDEFAKGLARHIDTAEELIAGLGPGLGSPFEYGYLAVAQPSEARGCPLRQAFAAVAKHRTRGAPGDQIGDAQLEATQRQRASVQEMALPENPRFAHIQQRELHVIEQHIPQGAGTDIPTHLRIPRLAGKTL